ncbi:MAG: 3-dehydroquinate synthase [Acutalibacteraceae bacterium]
MKTLNVKTGRSYNIYIKRGIISDCGKYIKEISNAQRVMVISDTNVAPIYSDIVISSLKKYGYEAFSFVFSAGEQSKKLETIESMYNALADNSFSRSDLIVALGGGVTGDMAGFAAATYQRGVSFVQIPTSLLAQVDSSVGGKTGVDIAQGKNLVGAFWQPSLVLIDPDTLKTLPQMFINDGMAEVIKYGCIKSSALFEKLEKENAMDIIDDVIYECVDIKRQVVENDEREKGERMLLNFGHTLGHSLEKVYNYTALTHGQAVAIGMALITGSSESKGLTQKGTLERLLKLIRKYNLPTSDKTDIRAIAENALTDKKSSGNDISIVLLKNIGTSFTEKMPKNELYGFLSK